MISLLNRAMQHNPLLAEAMTRALVSADASAASEADRVGELMDNTFAQVMSDAETTEVQYQVARAIADVWLSNLLAWLAHRATAADVSKRIDLVIRLLIGSDEG